MIRRFAAVLCLLLATGAPRAAASAPEPLEVAAGLVYLRIASLGGALPAVGRLAAERRAFILDLRHATTSVEEAEDLARQLAARPAELPAWFVLVSPDTPEVLAAALMQPPRGGLTLGVEGSRPRPLVVVAQPADTDRRAYAALAHGMPVTALIGGKLDKERYDESSLVRDFENGAAAPGPPAAPDPSAAPVVEKAPVLTDRVLQRAVHLHQALQALRHPAAAR